MQTCRMQKKRADREELKRMHREAGELFSKRNYAASLDLLDRLVAQFPNNPNLRFQRGLCLAKLGRTGEARKILNMLPDSIGPERLARLRRLSESQLPPLPGAESAPVPPPLPPLPNAADAQKDADPDSETFSGIGEVPRTTAFNADEQFKGKCSKCGAKMDPDDLICMDCGHVRTDTQTPAPSPGKRKSKR